MAETLQEFLDWYFEQVKVYMSEKEWEDTSVVEGMVDGRGATSSDSDA